MDNFEEKIQEVIDKPVNESAKEAEEAAEVSAEEVTEVSAEEATEEAAELSAEDTAEEAAETNTEESTVESVAELTEKSVEGPVSESVSEIETQAPEMGFFGALKARLGKGGLVALSILVICGMAALLLGGYKLYDSLNQKSLPQAIESPAESTTATTPSVANPIDSGANGNAVAPDDNENLGTVAEDTATEDTAAEDTTADKKADESETDAEDKASAIQPGNNKNDVIALPDHKTDRNTDTNKRTDKLSAADNKLSLSNSANSKLSDRESRLNDVKTQIEEVQSEQLLLWFKTILGQNSSITANSQLNNAANYSVINANDDSSTQSNNNTESSDDKHERRHKKSDSSDDDSSSGDDSKKQTAEYALNAKTKDISPYDMASSNESRIKVIQNNLEGREAFGEKKYTICVYLCGSDLETKKGDATMDILSLLRNPYSTEDYNIVICAGGSKGKGDTGKWWDGVTEGNGKMTLYYLDPSKIDFETEKFSVNGTEYLYNDLSFSDTLSYEVAGKIIEKCATVLGVYDALDGIGLDMGDSSLLSGFLNVCADYFPAEKYGLVLNDHGGAIIEGICVSEFTVEKDSNGKDIISKSVTASKLEEAIRSSRIFENTKDGEKALGFVDFDACLMGGIELAYNLSPYAVYMVGCSETELGSQDYSAMTKLFLDGNVNDKDLAESLVRSSADSKLGSYDICQTMGCYDTEKAVVLRNKIEEVAEKLVGLFEDPSTKENCYDTLKQARIHTTVLGGGGSRENTFDVVDLFEYFALLKVYAEDYVDKNPDNNDVSVYNSIINDISELSEMRDVTTFSYMNFGDSKVYNNAGAYNDAVKWARYVNESGNLVDLGMISIYVPMFSSKLSESNDVVKTEEIDNYSNNLLPQYEQLVKDFVTEYTKGADSQRVDRLNTYINDKDKNGRAIYSEIFKDPEMNSVTYNDDLDGGSHTVQVLHLAINEAFTDAQKNAHQEYEESVGNKVFANTPFENFMDTVQKMTAYISRWQNNVTGTGGTNLVYGTTVASFSNISAETESIDIITGALEKAVGYELEGFRYAAGVAKETASKMYDWVFNESLEEEKYEFNGTITDTNGYSYGATFSFEKEGNSLVMTGAKVFDGHNDEVYDTPVADLKDNYDYVQFNHYTVENGQLKLVDNSSIDDDGLRISLSSDIKITSKVLETDTNNSKYNDYTLGISYSTEGDGTEVYILDNGKAHGDDYKSYASNIGTSTALEVGLGSTNNAQGTEKRRTAKKNDVLTLLVADTYSSEKAVVLSSEEKAALLSDEENAVLSASTEKENMPSVGNEVKNNSEGIAKAEDDTEKLIVALVGDNSEEEFVITGTVDLTDIVKEGTETTQAADETEESEEETPVAAAPETTEKTEANETATTTTSMEGEATETERTDSTNTEELTKDTEASSETNESETPSSEVSKTEKPSAETNEPKTPSSEQGGEETPYAETNEPKTPSSEQGGEETPSAETNEPKTPSSEQGGEETPSTETNESETSSSESDGEETSSSESNESEATSLESSNQETTQKEE